MKKLFAFVLVTALLCMLFTFAASAEATTLMPDDEYWTSTDNGGCSCNVTFENGVAVVSGSAGGTWPCTTNYFDPSACIAANIDTYALHYDFKVNSGNTNINFYFSQNLDEMDNDYAFTLSNTSLGNVNYDSGSGDLPAGTYSGYVNLSDFVKATTFLGSKSFDSAYIDEDNNLYFTGVNIYSVNGATIEIYALELIPIDEIPEIIEESEEEEESQEAVESNHQDEESTAAAESDEASETDISLVNTSVTESTPTTQANGVNPIIWIIIGVAAVAVIIVIIVVVKKKK